MDISINSNIPSSVQVKRELSKGYAERRNFVIGSLFKMLVGYTPVDRGEAKGSWRISAGAPSKLQPDRLDPDGSTTIKEELGLLRGLHPFAHIFITNTAPHFPALEKGWSGQAPAGVMRVIVPAFKAIFEDVA